MGTAILAATTQAAYVQNSHTLIWAYIPIRFLTRILTYHIQKFKCLFCGGLYFYNHFYSLYGLFPKLFIWEILYYIDAFFYQIFVYVIFILIICI